MILQSLTRLYEALADQGEVERPGWTLNKVAWALDLGADGALEAVYSLMVEQPEGKKTTFVPRLLKTPMPVKRTAGVCANFLCDNAGYLLGVDAKGKPERTRQCFTACAALHEDVLRRVDTPAARAILAFFQRWRPEDAPRHPALAESLDEILKGLNLIFYYDRRPVTDDPTIAGAWQRYYDASGDGPVMRCLVTGQEAPAASVHPAVKNVRGAQSSGAALVSFNARAFCSYGHEQGLNAPVSDYAAFSYTTALNHLLADRAHAQVLGDTTVVIWAEGGARAYQDLGLMGLFGADPAEASDPQAVKQTVFAAIRHLAAGRAVDWQGIRLDPDTPFYILGLAPNAARLSVRFFLRNTFGGFMDASQAHHRRMEIARPAFDKSETLSLWQTLKETVNPNSRDKSPSPQMTGDVLRAVLTNAPYPATLRNAVDLRVRAERRITRGRAAILKAYYLKNRHREVPEEVLQVTLNAHSDYLPYVLGRLFSVLEQTQEAANGKATIQDKYFSSASATPQPIFALLLDLNRAHLRKLEPKLRIYYERQITELLGRIHTPYPPRMSQAERAAFQLGYYHENQVRYTKKEDRAK